MSKKEIEIDARIPDAFLVSSEKILKWVEGHAAIVGGICGLAVVGGLVWLGIEQFSAWQESKASSAIYTAQAELNRIQEALAKKEQERLEAAAKTATEKKTPPSKSETVRADFEKDLAGPAAKVEKTILEHRGTQAGAMAAIELAGLYMTHGKVEMAEALLTQVGDSGSATLKSLISSLRASVAMEKGDCEAANARFEEILQSKESDFLHPMAMLKMGVCYEKSGQFDRARDAYQRVNTEFGDTDSARTAKGYLRLLESKQKPKS